MLSVLFQESIFWPKTWSMRYWITSSNFTISRTETTCLHCLCKFPTSQSQELEVWESLNSIIQYFYCILAKIGNFTEKNKQTNNKKSSWAFNNYRYAGLVVFFFCIFLPLILRQLILNSVFLLRLSGDVFYVLFSVCF